MAGVTGDESARWAYFAEGNAKQARKRVAAKVLIRDENGAVLLVNPNYKEFWDLPGGMAEANEAPRLAAQREVLKELGIELTIGRLLALDWAGPQGPWDDQLVFTFDGGVLVAEDQRRLQVSDPELSSFEFVAVDDAGTRLRADVADRLVRTLAAVGTAGASYWEL